MIAQISHFEMEETNCVIIQGRLTGLGQRLVPENVCNWDNVYKHEASNAYFEFSMNHFLPVHVEM